MGGVFAAIDRPDDAIALIQREFELDPVVARLSYDSRPAFNHGGLFTRVYGGHWTDAGTVPSLLRAAELAAEAAKDGILTPPPGGAEVRA